MTELEELRERVARLEEHLGAVSTASRSLDEDQETMGRQLSAMRHLVQALSITQSEHTDSLGRIEGRLSRIEAGQALILRGVEQLLARDEGVDPGWGSPAPAGV